MENYSKLTKSEDYDKEAAEQLAAALNEIRTLTDKVSQLQDLVMENKKLHKFVWTTAEGKAIALHDIETDHLQNIMQHLINTGHPINKGIKSEARSRNLVIPTTHKVIEYTGANTIKRLAVPEIIEPLDW